MTNPLIESMRFSYSNLSSYENCPWGWKMNYIDRLPSEQNFWAEYGLFIHHIMELYFLNKIEIRDMVKYYKDNYTENVKTAPPPFPRGMAVEYYEDGIKLFEKFKFDRTKYEIVEIESSIEAYFPNGIFFVAKPDLVLREIATGNYLLFDYKTSKYSQEKADSYKKQMLIYAYFMKHVKNKPIHQIRIWFVRFGKTSIIDYKDEDAEEVVKWVYDVVEKIRSDEQFLPKPSSYFCSYLCGVRNHCEFKDMPKSKKGKK